MVSGSFMQEITSRVSTPRRGIFFLMLFLNAIVKLFEGYPTPELGQVMQRGKFRRF
jgi:hypothetical protein